MNDIEIRVGIPTAGEPVLERRPGGTLLRNMVIGLGFHWERVIEALLPGEVEHTDDPVFRLVNRLPLESYLECVVGSEMNPSSPAEFLKAHAVISRGWALGKILHRHDDSDDGKISRADLIIGWDDTCDHTGFDVCSDDHCQRYQGVQPIPPNVLRALRSTAGEVLTTPSGRIVDTRFSKCCGGRTEIFSTCWQDREEECLESFDDPWCDLSDLDDGRRNRVLQTVLKDYDQQTGGGYRWTATVTAKEIERNLKEKFGRDIGTIKDIDITGRGPSGRATRLRLRGTAGTLEIGKELMIRRLLSPTHLYSARFNITRLTPAEDSPSTQAQSSTEFHLEGQGWGHGVGLCQIGAARMALEGADYRRILAFYYPHSHLTPSPKFSRSSGSS